MNFAFLKKAAPFIAAVAGSAVPVAAPFLGLAAKKLSDGLGVKVDATADSIKDAISSAMGDPEKLGKLKQIDNEFAEHMKQLDIESAEKFEELAAGDRANAREMQIKMPSRLPGILAVVVTAGFFGLLGLIAYHEAPPGSEKILDVMTGSLGTAWIGVINYYFGSSAGSAAKTALLAQAPAIKGLRADDRPTN
jgi:hypothetical protein